MESNINSKHGTGAFVLSGLSFIPLIGVIPGLICIVNALISRKENSKKLNNILDRHKLVNSINSKTK